MLEALKEAVYKANLDLVAKGVVIYTWGNVSQIDRESGLVVIKPSGVEYDSMTAQDMVVVDLEGNVVEGSLRPSSDTPTHLEIYRNCPTVGGITHTHSTFACGFAQAGLCIPALGTTHADYFYGDIPCARELTEEEVSCEYERSTGLVIVDAMRGIDPLAVPGILVKNHGPFSFGKDAAASVYHAVVLEQVAKMAYISLTLNPDSEIKQYLLDKHYLRKHGANAYYGQSSSVSQE